jgi:dTDP-glucose pyrophosphorylase/predicted transcriptional regulator
MKKKIEKIKITEDATIKQALKNISNGDFQIALVVDKKSKLLGTLTDGDIRRGFLKGLDINSSIKSIFFKRPFVAKKTDDKNKLFKIAISKRIYQIPVIDKNGRVIDIHTRDELAKEKNKSSLVVIMAGGMGIRLRPLTKNIPKPMLKVGSKPILQIIIEQFKNNGFKNFVICVNYKSKIITNYFGDGEKFGVQIEYVHEKSRMGTAGCLSLLKKKPKESFFVINGDVLTNLDFEKMLNYHQEHNSRATMCIKQYTISLPYGEVLMKNENILSVNEKPKYKIFVNAGVYILDPKCLRLIPKKFYDMPSLFKKIIAKKEKAISFPLGEYWLDIGQSSDYKKANLEYASIVNNKTNIN